MHKSINFFHIYHACVQKLNSIVLFPHEKSLFCIYKLTKLNPYAFNWFSYTLINKTHVHINQRNVETFCNTLQHSAILFDTLEHPAILICTLRFMYTWIKVSFNLKCDYRVACGAGMEWLRLGGSLQLQVSFAEYNLLYRALLQKRPEFLGSHSHPIAVLYQI